jgi:hypothetical protein
VNRECVIAFIDSTIFGSAKEGVAFTNESIYIKKPFSKESSIIKYTDIEKAKCSHVENNDNFKNILLLDKNKKILDKIEYQPVDYPMLRKLINDISSLIHANDCLENGSVKEKDTLEIEKGNFSEDNGEKYKLEETYKTFHNPEELLQLLKETIGEPNEMREDGDYDISENEIVDEENNVDFNEIENDIQDNSIEEKEESGFFGFLKGAVNLVKKGVDAYTESMGKEIERMSNWSDQQLAFIARNQSVTPKGMAAMKILKERGYTGADIANL